MQENLLQPNGYSKRGWPVFNESDDNIKRSSMYIYLLLLVNTYFLALLHFISMYVYLFILFNISFGKARSMEVDVERKCFAIDLSGLTHDRFAMESPGPSTYVV